jgi:hypothetical protein
MSKRKNRKQESFETVDVILGVSWYTREQYDRLLELADDRDNLEDTYDEWQASAEKMMVKLSKPGVLPRKVHINVEELVAWCKAHNRPINGAARTMFVADKVDEEIGRKKRGN